MKALRWLLIILVLAAGGAAGYYRYVNPEQRTLDDQARNSAGAPGAFVALTDGITHYEAAGPVNGRVALLVHGFSVPSYIWDPTFKALSEAGYRVFGGPPARVTDRIVQERTKWSKIIEDAKIGADK